MTTKGSTTNEDNRSKAGMILEGSNGVLIEQSLHFEFKANNNQAEYETLLAGIISKGVKGKNLDSQKRLKIGDGPGEQRILGKRSPTDKKLAEGDKNGDRIRKIHTPSCAMRA
ncbi:hypothetical protein CR513_56006, partial [Mucuna pruriens]